MLSCPKYDSDFPQRAKLLLPTNWLSDCQYIFYEWPEHFTQLWNCCHAPWKWVVICVNLSNWCLGLGTPLEIRNNLNNLPNQCGRSRYPGDPVDGPRQYNIGMGGRFNHRHGLAVEERLLLRCIWPDCGIGSEICGSQHYKCNQCLPQKQIMKLGLLDMW